MDALQAIPYRAGKDRIEQQERRHGLGLDRLLARLAEHLVGPGTPQQGDPLQFIQHAAHFIGGGQQQEVLHIEDATGFIRPLQQAAKPAELPGEVAAQGGVGDPVEELAGAADIPQLFLAGLVPEGFVLDQGPIDVVELLPHLGGDHFANLARVLAGKGDAIDDAVGVVLVAHQEGHHVLGGGRRVKLVEQFPITTGLDQGQPGFGAAGGAVEGHGLAHLHKAGNVLRPLHVAVDPVQGFGNPAQHGTTSRLGASSTIQVSLQPPPWEEFTTSDPRRRATRVRPPGLTQAPLPLST